MLSFNDRQCVRWRTEGDGVKISLMGRRAFCRRALVAGQLDSHVEATIAAISKVFLSANCVLLLDNITRSQWRTMKMSSNNYEIVAIICKGESEHTH